MTHQHRAALTWSRHEDGGRQRPPSGPKHSTVYRLIAQHSTNWSLIVEFTKRIGSDLSHDVTVSHLSPFAPKELLQKGVEFELLEGQQAVARGRIIS